MFRIKHRLATTLSVSTAILLGAIGLMPASLAAAPDLFFSEYVEGSSLNKAIEIYNGTGATVDLSAYSLELYQNGSGTVGQSTVLSGMLVDGDVFVIANASADPAILAAADATNSLVINFNGDDAVVLRKAGSVVDAIGQVGFDPGSQWGSGDTSTQNNTIRRKFAICAGDTNATDAFTPSVEWNGFPNNTFDGLGVHAANCVVVPPVTELLLSELVIIPTEGEFIEIYNPTGSSIALNNVYLTDATSIANGYFYYNLPTGANAGGGSSNDFYARFPAGATIGAGVYQTVAMDDDFTATHGVAPTYELCNSGPAPNMREAFPGSIQCAATLSNSGEVVVLLEWDQVSDLVVDLDYALWGDKAEAVDKTGVTIGSSTYLADTAIASQDVIDNGQPHTFGESTQRDDLTEGTETTTGGNGAGGHDETSENLSVTWCVGTPTPNLPNRCPACGDGVTDNGEECDDGNLLDGDGCNASCQDEFCGDSVTQPGLGEECDDGNTTNGDGCQGNCLLPVCGDGILDPGEMCDDGNNADGDGCQGNCQDPFCGDGILDAGEECDDGNNTNADGCQANCLIPTCGDGILDIGEACDDGNTVDGDGCQGNCMLPFCGDGIVDAGEGCDDGNTFDFDGCSAACRPEGACCSNGPGIETECFITNDVDCNTNHKLYLGDGAECTSQIDCELLAATFDSLSATATTDGVLIRWVTSLETDTVGFRVLRETSGAREKALGIVVDRILAAGHGLSGASYEVLDSAEEAGIAVHYYVEDIDIFGKFTRHGPIAVDRGERQGPATRTGREAAGQR